jgi:hypothetical protein
MGMYLELAPVSTATIARLHADPALAMQIFDPDDPEAADRVRPKPKGPGLVGRLLGRKPPPPPPPPERLVLEPGEGTVVNIDKAWQAAHYLLTGSQWEGDPPLNFLLAGGTELDADWGDTPPRTFSPAETRAIAEAFAALTDDELGARFDPAQMMELEIYPEIWDRPQLPGEDQRGWVLEALRDVRTAVSEAARRGYGLLLSIG